MPLDERRPTLTRQLTDVFKPVLVQLVADIGIDEGLIDLGAQPAASGGLKLGERPVHSVELVHQSFDAKV